MPSVAQTKNIRQDKRFIRLSSAQAGPFLGSKIPAPQVPPAQAGQHNARDSGPFRDTGRPIEPQGLRQEEFKARITCTKARFKRKRDRLPDSFKALPI